MIAAFENIKLDWHRLVLLLGTLKLRLALRLIARWFAGGSR